MKKIIPIILLTLSIHGLNAQKYLLLTDSNDIENAHSYINNILQLKTDSAFLISNTAEYKIKYRTNYEHSTKTRAFITRYGNKGKSVFEEHFLISNTPRNKVKYRTEYEHSPKNRVFIARNGNKGKLVFEEYKEYQAYLKTVSSLGKRPRLFTPKKNQRPEALLCAEKLSILKNGRYVRLNRDSRTFKESFFTKNILFHDSNQPPISLGRWPTSRVSGVSYKNGTYIIIDVFTVTDIGSTASTGITEVLFLEKVEENNY